MNERDCSRERSSSPLADLQSKDEQHTLPSRTTSRSINSNATGSSSSSSSSSSNLSNLSILSNLSDLEKAEAHAANTSSATTRSAAAEGLGNRSASSSHREAPPNARTYSGLSTFSVGIRGFQSNILSPAQRVAKESLPSPPATSKGGESERGSIGSAQGQTSAALKDTESKGKRPSLLLDEMQPYSRHDAQATIRRSPVNAFPAAHERVETDPVIKLSESRSFRISSPHSPTSDHEPVSSPKDKTLSTLSRSRSRSPLIGLNGVSDAETSFHAKGDNMSSNLDKLSLSGNSENGDQNQRASATLSRTSSMASSLSRQSASGPTDKGKGREESHSPVTRKASISANKIRKASEASRARVGG